MLFLDQELESELCMFNYSSICSKEYINILHRYVDGDIQWSFLFGDNKDLFEDRCINCIVDYIDPNGSGSDLPGRHQCQYFLARMALESNIDLATMSPKLLCEECSQCKSKCKKITSADYLKDISVSEVSELLTHFEVCDHSRNNYGECTINNNISELRTIYEGKLAAMAKQNGESIYFDYAFNSLMLPGPLTPYILMICSSNIDEYLIKLRKSGKNESEIEKMESINKSFTEWLLLLNKMLRATAESRDSA